MIMTMVSNGSESLFCHFVSDTCSVHRESEQLFLMSLSTRFAISTEIHKLSCWTKIRVWHDSRNSDFCCS